MCEDLVFGVLGRTLEGEAFLTTLLVCLCILKSIGDRYWLCRYGCCERGVRRYEVFALKVYANNSKPYSGVRAWIDIIFMLDGVKFIHVTI
jgi:hypothetical protein